MKTHMKKNLLAIITVTAITITGCSEIDLNRSREALGHTMKVFTMSNDEIIAKSRLSAKQMDQQNRVAPSNSRYTRRLNNLTRNLRTYEGMNFNYKVYLSSQKNAFAMPDGTVRIYSGLMDILNDNELLAVIGHEIGHVKHQHVFNQYKQAYMTKAGISLMKNSSDEKVVATTKMYGHVAEAFAKAQFSQADELESDAFGVKLLHSIGRDPRAMITLQKKLRNSGGFFSSHPSSEKRARKATEIANALTKR